MSQTRPRAVVLVEGESDAEAVRAAAALLGHDLAAEQVVVVPLGGFTGARRYLATTSLSGVRVAGLCDEREAADFTRALSVVDDAAVFVCRADLEDELIRAVGTRRVERVLAANGDLAASVPCKVSRPTWPAPRIASCTGSSGSAAGARSGTAGCSSRRSNRQSCPNRCAPCWTGPSEADPYGLVLCGVRWAGVAG